MTRKIYKSAMGKTVDMGSLLLQNEQVRAVGNMNINARGDRLDSNNRVVEPKNQQVQRRYNKQTNVTSGPTASGTVSARQAKDNAPAVNTDTFADLPVDDPVDTTPLPAVPDPVSRTIPAGGLASAIARTREVKQELEKTQRQQAQSSGLRKI
jgi:hypothetical protein